MKKLFTICMILILTGLTALAQNPFIRDDNSKSTYLKFDSDKTGFGTVNPVEKVTIQSSSGETNLGLKPAKNQSNSVIKFYNSSGVVIAELWPTAYGFVIGKTKDTSAALMVANINKHYLKVNGSVNLKTSVTSPYVWCTGSSGSIFTATNGTSWKLQLTSAGTASYVTVTP